MKEDVFNRQTQGLSRIVIPTLAFVIVLVSATVLVVVVRARGHRDQPVNSAANVGRALGALDTKQVDFDEVNIELTANGFTPSEVQHAAGTFAIAVDNSVLVGEYTLKLKAEDGTVLKEIHVQKGSAAWSVSLQAGQYTLTESTNQQWVCRITIQ